MGGLVPDGVFAPYSRSSVQTRGTSVILVCHRPANGRLGIGLGKKRGQADVFEWFGSREIVIGEITAVELVCRWGVGWRQGPHCVGEVGGVQTVES